MVGSSSEQSIPKPSIPEFTIKYEDKSYDIAPTTTVDPYNGQTITVPGSHVKASAIEIRIQNEDFSPFTTDSGNHKVNYYYNIRWKGHFEENWNSAFLANYGSGFFPRSTGTETVFSTEGQYTCGFNIPNTANFSPGDQIDFQVEAMIGYVVDPGPFESEIFQGETSGWSSTQTISIPNGSVSASPTPDETFAFPTASASLLPTAAPTQSDANSIFPQLNWLTIGAFVALGVVVVLLVVFVVLLRRRIRVLELKQNGA